jgi:hypothetical protein
MKDEARATERASLEQILEDIPQNDLDRLRQQLTPLLSCAPIFPDDRDATTAHLQEWQMRGLPVPAFNAVYDLLWEDHRAAREASAASMRGHFEREYAPWFEPEPKPQNPTLHVLPPRSSSEAGERVAAYVDKALLGALAGGTPDRPDPSLKDRFHRFLRGSAPGG